MDAATHPPADGNPVPQGGEGIRSRLAAPSTRVCRLAVLWGRASDLRMALDSRLRLRRVFCRDPGFLCRAGRWGNRKSGSFDLFGLNRRRLTGRFRRLRGCGDWWVNGVFRHQLPGGCLGRFHNCHEVRDLRHQAANLRSIRPFNFVIQFPQSQASNHPLLVMGESYPAANPFDSDRLLSLV